MGCDRINLFTFSFKAYIYMTPKPVVCSVKRRINSLGLRLLLSRKQTFNLKLQITPVGLTVWVVWT